MFKLKCLDLNILQVDLTEYVEKHEFIFDAVLNEEVSNDEVMGETEQILGNN